MKLVNILARDWPTWPYDHTAFVSQDSDQDTAAFAIGDQRVNEYGNWNGDSYISGSLIGLTELADDYHTAIVTYGEWEIARESVDVTWNGSGLPPVGTVCEWSGCTSADEDPKEPDLHIGDQVKIIAHFKDGEFELAAFTFNPQIHNADRGTAWVNQGAFGCFRPIRTPEQIAAEEREKFVEDLASLTSLPHPESRVVFAMIYDAGYRKTDVQ